MIHWRVQAAKRRHWHVESGSIAPVHVGLIETGAYKDEAGNILFAYAHPLFWAPYTIIGDGGANR